MLTKETIKKTLIDNLPLLRRYRVLRIGLFGSYVRNMASENSDIDLLIETDSGMDLMNVVDLELRLSGILGSKVDLVSVKGLNKHLKEHILREAEFVEGI